MIRVVGANPAMDRVSTWPPVRLGEVNRASSVSVVPGGKGFNVARGVIRLGSQATAYGFLGGPVGEALRAMILADGVIDRHTDIAAGTRVCFIVVEPDSARSTVLNEPGPMVTEEEISRFLARLREDCRPNDIVILSGSLPDSVDPRVAREIVAIGNEAGARMILDIHGASLRAAVEAAPWMVKCNRDELLGLIDDGLPRAVAERRRAMPLADLAVEMLVLRTRGIELVVVTLGSEGVLLADRDGVIQAVVPEVAVVNSTGAGDLLMAGLAVGIERGMQPREAIVLGAACGTSSSTHLAPELLPGFDADQWATRISVHVVEPSA